MRANAVMEATTEAVMEATAEAVMEAVMEATAKRNAQEDERWKLAAVKKAQLRKLMRRATRLTYWSVATPRFAFQSTSCSFEHCVHSGAELERD